MPLYDYQCQSCGEVSEHQVPIPDRLDKQDCPHCQTPKSCGYLIAAATIGSAIPKGDKRIIQDERQVHDSHGRHWRDTGTTGKEGGVGRKLILT